MEQYIIPFSEAIWCTGKVLERQTLLNCFESIMQIYFIFWESLRDSFYTSNHNMFVVCKVAWGVVWFPNPLGAGSQMGTLSTRGVKILI